MTLYRRLVFGITIAIVFVIIILSVSMEHLPKTGKEIEENSSKFYLPFTKEDITALGKGITLSREYQMKLFAEKFIHREEALTAFLEDMSNILEIPEIKNISEGLETVRFQRVYNTEACGKKFNPRVRNYYTGYRTGTSSIDIKSGTTGYEGPAQILQNVYQPFPKYMNDSEIKFEWDVHPCKIKYSLESRIFLPNFLELKTCKDLANMFIRVSEKIVNSRLEENISVDRTYSTWIYELEHHGKLPFGDTEFKTSLTFLYNSMDDAIEGVRKPTDPPEWSIRLWSTEHGTKKWLKSTLNYINMKYSKLLEHFDSPDLPCTGTFPPINETLKYY